MPLQAPLHPENIDPPAGDADKVTVVPALYALLQSSPQLMPAGLLMTVPVPAPAFVTVRVARGRRGGKRRRDGLIAAHADACKSRCRYRDPLQPAKT